MSTLGSETHSIELGAFRVLLQVSTAMMSEKDPDRLLDLILEKANLVCQAERSTLFLVDQDTNEIYTHFAKDLEIPEIRIPIGSGIAGHVAESGELVNIPDAYADERFNQEVDKKTGFTTRSILCAPLDNREGERIGVIQVLNKRLGVFTGADEEMIQAFAAQAAVALENAILHQEQERAFQSFLDTMVTLIDARDNITGGHTRRVAKYAHNLAVAMKLTQQELKQIDFAAALHDIGKLKVKDAILMKPGKLTDEEFKEIRNHAQYTKDFLEKIHFPRDLREVPQIAGNHHERLDGKGYPAGLTEKDIAPKDRILCIVDVYDALTANDRPYRRAMTPDEAMKILIKDKGTAFDPELVDLFINEKCYILENREFPRHIPGGEAQCLKPATGDTFSASVVNASACGILLEYSGKPGLRQPLELTFKIGEREYSVEGRVVRQDPVEGKSKSFHVGVAFIKLTRGVRDHIADDLAKCDEWTGEGREFHTPAGEILAETQGAGE